MNAGETPALPGGASSCEIVTLNGNTVELLVCFFVDLVDDSVYPCNSSTISRAACLAFSGWSGGKEMAATTGCPPPP